MKRTPRGFSIFTAIKDSNGHTVRVQESSRCGGPYVWLFCNNDETGHDAVIHFGTPVAISPHLTRAQARRVAKALLKFANGDSP